MKKGDESKISLCYLRGSRDRSSRLYVFCKKGVLRNFTKFTGKYLCQSLFFNKIAGLTLTQDTFSYRTYPMPASREIPLTPIANVVA